MTHPINIDEFWIDEDGKAHCGQDCPCVEDED